MSSPSPRLRRSILLLIICNALAAFLLISNFTGLYDILWSDLDTAIFRALNATVTPDGAMTHFWAWTNSKAFDHGTFVLMLLICIYLVLSAKREDRIEVIAKLGAITFLILLALLISKRIIGEFYHPSPGLALRPYNDINSFISGYTVKTSTDNSFPGDHAMTSALFAGGVILLFHRPYVATLSVLLMIFVSLPRLAGGGHWATDVIIGGGAACLILLPWLKVFPIVKWIEKLLSWGWRKAPAFMQSWAGRP